MYSAHVFFMPDSYLGKKAKDMMLYLKREMESFIHDTERFNRNVSNLALRALPTVNERRLTPQEFKERLIEMKDRFDKRGIDIQKKYWYIDRKFGSLWSSGQWYDDYYADFDTAIVCWDKLDRHAQNVLKTELCGERDMHLLSRFTHYNDYDDEEEFSDNEKTNELFTIDYHIDFVIGSMSLMPYFLVQRFLLSLVGQKYFCPMSPPDGSADEHARLSYKI